MIRGAPPIAVIGPREATPEQLATARALGKALAERGFAVICGGKGGVMEAVCEGMREEGGGLSIGLLPEDNCHKANPHVDLPLATGIGLARNAVIATAARCLIAVGGGHGTFSEVAYGLQYGKPVYGLCGAPKVAGVVHVETVEEVLAEL